MFVYISDRNLPFFPIPTGRNNSAPSLFLGTVIMYRLVLFLPFTLIFAGESYHAAAIYTNTVLSTDCIRYMVVQNHKEPLCSTSATNIIYGFATHGQIDIQTDPLIEMRGCM